MFFKASTKNSIIMDLYLKEKEKFFSKHFHLINKDTNLNYQNKKGDTLSKKCRKTPSFRSGI